MNADSFNILLLDGGQWAIINECRGNEDVLIKREDFSFPKNSADEGRGKSPADGWPLRHSNIRKSERERERESVTGKSESEGILLLKFHVKKKRKKLIFADEIFIFRNWPSMGKG